MKKYLVIGNPIEHSLSPLLHNFWFKKYGVNAIYEKKLLEQNDIEQTLNDIRENLKKALEEGIKNEPPFPFGFGNSNDVANFVFKKSIKKSKVSNFVGRDTKIINFFIKIFGRELLFKIIKKLWFSRILPKKEL